MCCCCLQAAILRDVEGVVNIVITLKTFFPTVDAGNLLQRTPKLLLRPVEQIQADAQQVHRVFDEATASTNMPLV